MGGNAFENTVPLTKIEHQGLARDVGRAIARSSSGLLGYAAPHVVRGKELFNDLDYIAGVVESTTIRIADVIDMLLAEGICHPDTVKWSYNKPVLSVLSEQGHQIDLIIVGRGSEDYAAFFYGLGDVGTVLVRLASALGLQLRHDGLYYKADGKLHLITNNIGKTFTVLGYDSAASVWNRLRSACEVEDTPESRLATKWPILLETKYFNPDHFNPELQKGSTKSGLLKRPLYMEFWEFAKNKPLGSEGFVTPDLKRASVLVEDISIVLAIADTAAKEQQVLTAKRLINAEAVQAITQESIEESGRLSKAIWMHKVNTHGSEHQAATWLLGNAAAIESVITANKLARDCNQLDATVEV